MNFLDRYLPSLAPGAAAFLNPWVLLVVIGIAVAGFTAGMKVEGWRWDASLKDVAEWNTKYIQGFMGKQRQENGEISARLAATQAQADADRRKFEEQLQHAKDGKPQGTIFTVSADPESTGDSKGAGEAQGQGLNLATARLRVTCDRACIGLWHDGLAQGLPDAYSQWRADAAAGAPDSVDEADLIRNAAENFALANHLRAQLLGWQRKACHEGWASRDECTGLTP